MYNEDARLRSQEKGSFTDKKNRRAIAVGCDWLTEFDCLDTLDSFLLLFLYTVLSFESYGYCHSPLLFLLRFFAKRERKEKTRRDDEEAFFAVDAVYLLIV